MKSVSRRTKIDFYDHMIKHYAYQWAREFERGREIDCYETYTRRFNELKNEEKGGK